MRLYAILQIHGLQNYADVLMDPDILASIGRSFFVSMLSLVLALVLGVLLALWIHMLTKGAAYILQLLVLIPWVTSMIVAAMLWKWIFQDDTGLLNYLLSLFGVGNVGFLTDKTIAIYTLVFVMTWRVIGYVMIQVLAGLKAIPVEYEEAAKIDGANKWQMFWRVRFTSLKNTYGPVSDYCGPFQFKQPKRTSNLAGGRAGNLHHGRWLSKFTA